jgi:hypothetical protein
MIKGQNGSAIGIDMNNIEHHKDVLGRFTIAADAPMIIYPAGMGAPSHRAVFRFYCKEHAFLEFGGEHLVQLPAPPQSMIGQALIIACG